MEGTRNERVAILLASYVIGFITAYIAFGVIQLESTPTFAQLPSQNAAAVITSQKVAQTPSATFLAIDKEGLVLIKDNVRTLLSASADATGDTFFTDGQHVAIVDYSLSPDSKSVYFCELPTADADSCRPYIYSITNDTVYPVQIAGERVAFDATDQSVSWSEAGELIIN